MAMTILVAGCLYHPDQTIFCFPERERERERDRHTHTHNLNLSHEAQRETQKEKAYISHRRHRHRKPTSVAWQICADFHPEHWSEGSTRCQWVRTLVLAWRMACHQTLPLLLQTHPLHLLGQNINTHGQQETTAPIGTEHQHTVRHTVQIQVGIIHTVNEWQILDS